MRRLNRVGALLLGAAAALVGVTPRFAPAAKAQVQEGSQRSKGTPAMPTPAAKKGQVVSEQTLGGFTVRSAPWGSIWTGRPRGGRGAGFPFRRIKGKKWSPRA